MSTLGRRVAVVRRLLGSNPSLSVNKATTYATGRKRKLFGRIYPEACDEFRRNEERLGKGHLVP